MIKIIIALSGILFGHLLARIAPEELKEGKKYFYVIKTFLFIFLFGAINYYFFKEKLFVNLLIFAVLMAILFVINLKFKKQLLELPNYILFIVAYFFIPQISYQLLISTLIFLYGFPVGTLLKR